jgi:hypothetical protein
MSKRKIHYVKRIIPAGNDGWAACGFLVKEEATYNAMVKGRTAITCLNCQRALQRQDRRERLGKI